MNVELFVHTWFDKEPRKMGFHFNKGNQKAEIRKPKLKSFKIFESVIKYLWKILKLQKR